MDKEVRLNSPRTLLVCRMNGILPEELYYVDYKDYLSSHPEISNLPEEVKQFRFKLLEKLRQKNIKMIKERRKEFIEDERKKNESEVYESRERITLNFNNFNTHESDSGHHR